jgi:hypothetical protein
MNLGLARSSLFASFLLFVPACASEPESVARDDADLTVRPSGPGGDATLTVELPPEVFGAVIDDAGTSTAAALRIFYGKNQEVRAGVPTRVRPEPDREGFSPITIKYSAWGHQLTYGDRLTLKSGDNLTLRLGAVRLGGWTTADVPNIDVSGFHPREGIDFVWGDNRYPKWVPETADGWWIVKYWSPALPVFAGHYEYSFHHPAFPILPFDVAAGKVTSLDVGQPDPFARVSVTRASDVAFSDAPNTSTTSTVSCGIKAANVTLGTTATLFTASPTTCLYVLNRATSAPFAVDPRQTVAVTAQRLEVDDVALTDEAGTKVHGTYSVYQWRPGGVRSPAILSNAPTKTGVDLPPGSYHITIRYTSPQGLPQTQEQDVQL